MGHVKTGPMERGTVLYAGQRDVEKTSWNDKDTGEIVEAFSVKINQAPIGWDGDCVAVPYRERPDKDAA